MRRLRNRLWTLRRTRTAIPWNLVLTVLIVLIGIAKGDSIPVNEASPGSVYFREDFDNLDSWKPLKFRNIEKMSSYTVEAMAGTGSCLRAQSNDSSSALAWKGEFDVYKYPMMKWRWKVSNVYPHGNSASKTGDDYPIRINIMFKYDPKDPHVKKQFKYAFGKFLYGKYPPYTDLIYIWANQDQEPKDMPSPYAPEIMMIPLRAGPKLAGRWEEEEVNVLDDYRAAFGTDPPRMAGLAIMNDSDNMGGSSVSWVDWIEIFRPSNRAGGDGEGGRGKRE